MDYKALFADKTTLEGSNFTCRLFCEGGLVAVVSEERYPVLFVLVGELQLFDDQDKVHTICASEMVIAERSRIDQIMCRPNTIVMEYRLPAALTARFPALPKSLTPPIPITGRLEVWLDDCLHGSSSAQSSSAQSSSALSSLAQSSSALGSSAQSSSALGSSAQSSGELPEGDDLADLLILYQSRRLQPLINAFRSYASEQGFLRQLKPRR